MNSVISIEDGNGSPFSQEFKQASDDLRNKIALRRQALRGMVPWDAAKPTPPLVPPDVQPPVADLPLDFNPPPKPGDLKEEKALPKKDSIMERLARIEQDLDAVLPTFSHMNPEMQTQIMTSIADQERVWGALRLADIDIATEEVAMWGGFLGGAKKIDFIEQNSVETLESGEIVDLVIDGFKSFQIVKIRSKNKDSCAMSVIEFIIKGGQEKVAGDYLITLPLIEGGSLSILRQKTMEPVMSYKIRKMSLNKRQRSLLQKIFDFLT